MSFRTKRPGFFPFAPGASATAPRRSRKSIPTVIEALEGRALLSGGLHALAATAPVTTPYTLTPLVRDVASMTPPGPTTIDPNLVNPWGIAASPAGPFWVSDNGKGVSTLYDGSGIPQPAPPKAPLVVTIPLPAGTTTGHSAPTGIVFNGSTTDFGGAPFLFATEDGTIAAWNPPGSLAALKVDNSATGAVYKGLALATVNGSGHLFATNFHAGKVEEYDSAFNRVALAKRAFTDRQIPSHFAPFGVQAVNFQGTDVLVVTYAKQKKNKHDDQAGPGNGFVDAYDLNGNLLLRVASRGKLNSPWGIAVAPGNFGSVSNDLLIGDFGDGRINAFQPVVSTHSVKFKSVGPLRDASNTPITIDGLWGLKFGNGGKAGSTNALYFTAGTNGEADGLFGKLTTP